MKQHTILLNCLPRRCKLLFNRSFIVLLVLSETKIMPSSCMDIAEWATKLGRLQSLIHLLLLPGIHCIQLKISSFIKSRWNFPLCMSLKAHNVTVQGRSLLATNNSNICGTWPATKWGIPKSALRSADRILVFREMQVEIKYCIIFPVAFHGAGTWQWNSECSEIYRKRSLSNLL